jgi:hypothetical protein
VSRRQTPPKPKTCDNCHKRLASVEKVISAALRQHFGVNKLCSGCRIECMRQLL